MISIPDMTLPLKHFMELVLPPFQVLNSRSRNRGSFDGSPYLGHCKGVVVTSQPWILPTNLSLTESHEEPKYVQVLPLSPAALLIYLPLCQIPPPPPKKR